MADLIRLTRLDNRGWHVLCAAPGCVSEGPSAALADGARTEALGEGWTAMRMGEVDAMLCPDHKPEPALTEQPPDDDDVMF